MTRLAALFLVLAASLFACGDRVLGGVSSDGAVIDEPASSGSGSDPCATYIKGSLRQAGVSTVDYCNVAGKLCGFGEQPGRPTYYIDAADCAQKYSAESESAKTCSGGGELGIRFARIKVLLAGDTQR